MLYDVTATVVELEEFNERVRTLLSENFDPLVVFGWVPGAAYAATDCFITNYSPDPAVLAAMEMGDMSTCTFQDVAHWLVVRHELPQGNILVRV